MWTYHQKTGHLYLHGKLVATGYSGAHGAINDPDQEEVADKGPIPRGHYKIGTMIPHYVANNGKTFVNAMRVEPMGHKAHGRAGFLIHGDNAKGDHSASHGCIILTPDHRKHIAKSGITDLHVYR